MNERNVPNCLIRVFFHKLDTLWWVARWNPLFYKEGFESQTWKILNSAPYLLSWSSPHCQWMRNKWHRTITQYIKTSSFPGNYDIFWCSENYRWIKKDFYSKHKLSFQIALNSIIKIYKNLIDRKIRSFAYSVVWFEGFNGMLRMIGQNYTFSKQFP